MCAARGRGCLFGWEAGLGSHTRARTPTHTPPTHPPTQPNPTKPESNPQKPNQVIASEAIQPYRKDVLAKCYGGDISRKKKLLQKQADGKKRMKALGKVEVPQAAFMAVLKIDRDGKD